MRSSRRAIRSSAASSPSSYRKDRLAHPDVVRRLPRGAGGRPAGASQHRPGLRRRRGRRRPLFVMSTSRGPTWRLVRQPARCPSHAPATMPGRRRWVAARLRARHGASGHQAGQPAAGDERRRGQGTRHGPGPPGPPGDGRRRHQHLDAGRHGDGDARLHRPGASPRLARRRYPRRLVQPGMHAVLPAGRPRTVSRRQPDGEAAQAPDGRAAAGRGAAAGIAAGRGGRWRNSWPSGPRTASRLRRKRRPLWRRRSPATRRRRRRRGGGRIAAPWGGDTMETAAVEQVSLAPSGDAGWRPKDGGGWRDTRPAASCRWDWASSLVLLIRFSCRRLARRRPRCATAAVAGHAAPAFDDGVKRMVALPAEQQVKAVSDDLKKRNPGFDGNVTPTVESGVVVGLEFGPTRDAFPVVSLGGIVGDLADADPIKREEPDPANFRAVAALDQKAAVWVVAPPVRGRAVHLRFEDEPLRRQDGLDGFSHLGPFPFGEVSRSHPAAPWRPVPRRGPRRSTPGEAGAAMKPDEQVEAVKRS